MIRRPAVEVIDETFNKGKKEIYLTWKSIGEV